MITTKATYDVGTGFVLADYDGDGAMEIFFNQGWGVTIVDGNGTQLTAGDTSDPRPSFVTKGTLLNTPAVSDIDGDGQLEMVIYNSQLYLWELPNSGPNTEWAMFKKNARRTYSAQPYLGVTPGEITQMAEAGQDVVLTLSLSATSVETFSYEITATKPPYFDVPVEGNSAGTETTVVLTVPAPALALGLNDLGSLEITATSGGRALAESPTTVSVSAVVVEELQQLVLPLLQR